jgi:hypothetical protein
MYLKKTLVLSSLDASVAKAVVNVEKFKNRMEGQVRLYNFDKEPSGILTLGILHDGKVLKAGLTQEDSRLYSFVLEDGVEILEGAKSITCAIINFNQGQPTPILFGSSDGKAPTSTEIRLASALSVFDKPLDRVEVESVLDEYQIDYEDQEKAHIENLIDQAIQEEEPQEIDEPQPQQEQKHVEKGAFYREVKEQISDLFSNYPEEEFLTNIIPHSKWVRVDYEKNGHYYVVGLIYEEGILKYICYGMPGMWEEKPPKEMEGVCQWLPLDPDKPQDFGYWLAYQDADTGDNIKVEVI